MKNRKDIQNMAIKLYRRTVEQQAEPDLRQAVQLLDFMLKCLGEGDCNELPHITFIEDFSRNDSETDSPHTPLGGTGGGRNDESHDEI